MSLIQVLVFQMLRWMLLQKDLWIACECGGIQMDASTEGLVAACEHPGTTIPMDTKAEGLAEEHEQFVMFAMDASTDWCVVAHRQNQDFMLCLCYVCYGCLNTDLFLNMDIVKIVKVYVMFTMDASGDGLVVAHIHCYNFVVVMLCYICQTCCGGSSLNYKWYVLNMCMWCQ